LGCIAGLLKLWATRQRWVARPAKLVGLKEEVRWVGPSGSAQNGWIRFFSNLFLVQNNCRKSRNCFKDTKNTRKIPKIPGKFPEAHWNMNNSNKIFGVHEKDFRAF
jgi:hypothetical protein